MGLYWRKTTLKHPSIMLTALVLLTVASTCSGRPRAGLSGAINGPVEIITSNGGGKNKVEYDLDDLTFNLAGQTAFPGIPNLGAGNIQGTIAGGTIRVKSFKDLEEDEIKYAFDNLKFKVDSPAAGEAKGTINGPIAVSSIKDGALQTDLYNFKGIRFDTMEN